MMSGILLLSRNPARDETSQPLLYGILIFFSTGKPDSPVKGIRAPEGTTLLLS
jgi:hypothetical protein